MQTHILLAEDDVLIGEAYLAGLTAAGYKVDRVFNGKEALKVVEKKPPTVLLLDLRMPGLDGFQVLERMKRKKLLDKVVVIVVSNLDQESAVSRCKKLGAKDYLIKSNTSFQELVKTVERHV